jgi:hypothetical protein
MKLPYTFVDNVQKKWLIGVLAPNFPSLIDNPLYTWKNKKKTIKNELVIKAEKLKKHQTW